jgi:alpha-tubulin suppressor-like RCC1 family protein
VCAIRADGRPECWFIEPWPDKWNVTPPPDVELTQISCGSDHWCGVTVDGEITCWGLVGSWLDVPP